MLVFIIGIILKSIARAQCRINFHATLTKRCLLHLPTVRASSLVIINLRIVTKRLLKPVHFRRDYSVSLLPSSLVIIVFLDWQYLADTETPIHLWKYHSVVGNSFDHRKIFSDLMRLDADDLLTGRPHNG